MKQSDRPTKKLAGAGSWLTPDAPVFASYGTSFGLARSSSTGNLASLFGSAARESSFFPSTSDGYWSFVGDWGQPPEEEGSDETTVGPQLDTEGLQLGQLESLLREELKPGVDGTALDPKIAQSIVDQIAAAIKAEVKRTGGNMTAAQVDAEVARIAKQMGFDITPTLVAETKDDTIQSPGGDITVTN